MAKLLKHRLDCVRVCPTCGALCEQHYDGAQLVADPKKAGGIAEARQYTCTACGGTHNADFEPRPDIDEERLLEITDLRAWERRRAATLQQEREKSIAALAELVRLAATAGRYSLVGEAVP